MSGVDRMRQVNEQLRTVIGRAIQQELDMPLGVLVTITRVDTSRDLQTAVVYVMILPNTETDSVMRFLDHQRHHIQSRLGSVTYLKKTPKIRFMMDTQQMQAQTVYDILDTEIGQ